MFLPEVHYFSKKYIIYDKNWLTHENICYIKIFPVREKNHQKSHQKKTLNFTSEFVYWCDFVRYLYLQFLNENTEESDSHIKTADLYEHFKGWFKTNNPNT